MNKYELKYLLETQTSINDRLTDTLGKQSTHIADLYEEIKTHKTRIESMAATIQALHKKVKEREEVIRSQTEKNLTEYHFPESVDN